MGVLVSGQWVASHAGMWSETREGTSVHGVWARKIAPVLLFFHVGPTLVKLMWVHTLIRIFGPQFVRAKYLFYEHSFFNPIIQYLSHMVPFS